MVLRLPEGKREIRRSSKNIIIIALAAVLIFIAGMAAGFFITNGPVQENDYIARLYLTGDVSNSLNIDELDLTDYLENISYDGEKLEAFSLEKILSLAEPAGNEYSIYLIAADGRTARLSGGQIEKSYIRYGDIYGWETINLYHPVSTNIKEVREIIVVLEEEDLDYSLNIIDMDKDIASITPGQVNLSASRFLKYGGTSFKDVDDRRYESSTFELKHVFNLENFLESENPEKMILMGSMGEYRFVDNTGYFELDGNVFNYVDSSQNEKLGNLKGIVIDPSPASIMDVYYDANGFINQGNNVMLIITDGLGYQQYEFAMDNGHAPFLASLEKAKKALSVYKPVSNPGDLG